MAADAVASNEAGVQEVADEIYNKTAVHNCTTTATLLAGYRATLF